MSDLQNVFSWSKSRDEEFRECKRKYFYSRYFSWGGWEAKAPPGVRAAYVLKNLKNRWAWKGERVHHVIEHVLKSLRGGTSLELDRALEHLTRLMRQDYLSSKAKKNWEDPKRNIGLFEHEYARAVSDATWKEIHDTSAQCIRNFYESSFFKELSADSGADWLLIEDLEEFDFEGAKIFVKLDFARKKNDAIEIYDWKTGKTDGQAWLQIGTYAMYAMKKWNAPLSSIRAYLVGLAERNPEPKLEPLTEKVIEDTKLLIRESIQAMHALLINIPKNSPKTESEFSFTENARACDFCAFYKICGKWGKTA